jgi:putative hydrolases of HD superfamily
MAIKRNQLKKAASFLYEVGTMRKIARSHRQTLLTDDLSDNISSHSYRVTWIGWLLATLEKADTNKVVKMCLSHDISEARSNDQNWVNKKYVKVFENEITADQIKNLPVENEMEEITKEYQERKTKEAKIAKDADLLDQILLLKEYAWQGNNEAVDWLGGKNGKGNMQYKLLTTPSAKKLADEILKQNPSDWWRNIWTEKRR